MTPEDEAFEELESAQKWRVEDNIRRMAQVSAMQFIEDNNVTELGMMTLRKAYEIGYRAGMYAAQRKKDE
jgi:predicted DNA binding protein